jgi:hypothetical protein
VAAAWQSTGDSLDQLKLPLLVEQKEKPNRNHGVELLAEKIRIFHRSAFDGNIRKSIAERRHQRRRRVHAMDQKPSLNQHL